MPTEALALTPEQTIWYDRVLAGMAASNVLIEDIMNSGDVYSIGREGGNYTESLILAYRASGDRRFLDRLLQLTQLARAQLRDAWLDGTTDGYTSWLWLVDPTNATYYGKDTDWLDESISSGNAALWMYTFHQNRQLDPAYAEAADFWRNWLETQFLGKSYARAGGALAAWNTPFASFYKPDTEPRSANWRMAYYLWKVTGNTFYRDREQEIRTQLVNAFQVNPANGLAYRWARQLDPTTQEWQTINYANYVMRVVTEMNLEGVPFFSSPATMKHFASTFRDVVYGGLLSIVTMKNDVNGGGSTGFALYAMNAFSPWDTTGFLMNLATLGITGAGHYAGGGTSKAARNDVYISSYALMALAPRGSVGVDPAIPIRAGLALGASEPNPFTTSTMIHLTVPSAGRVRLAILDATGRQVRVLRDGDLPAGSHAVAWDGRDDSGAPLPSGIYFQVAQAGGRSVTRRMVRVR